MFSPASESESRMSESLKHRFAKNAVAKWLAADPLVSAETEYPICIDAENETHGLRTLWPIVPTYQHCIDSELLPLVIFDVVAIQGERITDVFEIVHTNPISDKKAAYIKRLQHEQPFRVWEVAPAEVLAWTERPDWMPEVYNNEDKLENYLTALGML